MASVTPEVLWAQRSSSSDAAKNHVFLTLMVSDVPAEGMKLDLQPTKLSFKGTSTSKKVTYAVELEFFAEIDPKESKIHHTGRDIEMVLRKKDLKEEYWPRLLKDSKKMHFLKTDFDKHQIHSADNLPWQRKDSNIDGANCEQWVDEDEQDAQPDDEDYMSKMNPMGGGGDGGFGGIDFSKLGAAQGAGGLPDLGDMADHGEESSEDEDDDMPELENDDGKPAPAAAATAAAPAAEASTDKPKIEEGTRLYLDMCFLEANWLDGRVHCTFSGVTASVYLSQGFLDLAQWTTGTACNCRQNKSHMTTLFVFDVKTCFKL
ncbi:HSP20-like chaperone [Lindgomyces ingoldianus]|uniref:HSP20-like chaperone n=1 Tax=Lindgomyces ingoldianus TaxID=673940 RepID=A0ACB6Q9C0_9PLEO|nr:HSP20-like chaperone [Lindgomyces ingoldianus]KAF2463135.1 HSP20-like chaperone [Lindgomyces ingoldianus]